MTTVDRLARRIAELERVVRDVASTPQLAHSAIVDGAIDQVRTVDTGMLDEFGNPIFREEVVARYGAQGDGGNNVTTFDDPEPRPPTEPVVTAGPGFVVVGWDGRLQGTDVIPSYVRAIGVFIGLYTDLIPSAETLRAELPPTSEGTEVTVGSLPAGDYMISLCAISQSGRWSEPAPYRIGGPGTGASSVRVEEAIRKAEEAFQAALTAGDKATAADARAAEARALADAVSSSANRVDAKAIEALRLGDVSILAADGKSTITYSLSAPGTSVGSEGDTWYQVDTGGVVVGFWECSDGDATPPDSGVPEPTAVVPPAPTFVNRPGTSRDSYTVPAAAGVAYVLDGVEVAPGTYTDREGAVAMIAAAQPGFVFPVAAKTAWAGTLATDGTGVRDPVSAADPVFRDEDGAADDVVEFFDFDPPDGAQWVLNGDPVPAGTHPASGTVEVEAVAGEFFTFGGAQTTWTYTFDPLTYVTPAAPTFTDRSGTAEDKYTIPAATGVIYRTGTITRAPGQYPGTGEVTVTAYPQAGYALRGDTAWTHTFSTVVNPDVEVTPAAPTFTDPPGTANDTYTIPATTGATYTVNGATAAAGTYPATGTISVAAVADDGYVIVGTSSWQQTFSTARTPVSPPPPTFTDVDGTASDTVAIPARTGVQYRVNGTPRPAGTYPATGTATVTAEAASDTYTIAGTAQWTFDFDPLRYVTPDPPTFDDRPGAAQDTVTIPDTPGVAYRVNGGPVAPSGPRPASGATAVTAEPTSGHAFTQGATESWSHTYSTARTPVTPAPPIFVDANGSDNDTYEIPNIAGVVYTAEGVTRGPGIYPATGTILVTAAAASDAYTIPSGATRAWNQQFDPLTYVTPAAPTWDDSADEFTIPTTAGVEYRRDGQTVTAGTYTVPVGATITSTDFTGSPAGQPWPSPWDVTWEAGPQSRSYVSNQKGIILAQGIGNWASKQATFSHQNLADFDLQYTLLFSGSEMTFHHLMTRVPVATAQPSDGYDLLIRSSGVSLHRVVAWASSSVLGTYDGLQATTGTLYRVRFRAEGITLQAKIWPASQGEPSSWHINATDTRWATGLLGFHIVGGGSASTPYSHIIDDITITNQGGSSTVTVDITAHPTTGHALTGTTSWSHIFTGGD